MRRVLVGFNNFHFDGPVLVRRSQYLGVPYPELSFDKYRSPDVDLMQRLTFNGTIDAKKLQEYARLFCIPGAGTDECNGSQIAALVKADEWATVASHCACDVALTKGLAERLGWLPPGALVFDLETVAREDAADFLEPPCAPANYKDPDKIAAFIADATAKRLDKCALDPDLNRIVAIGTPEGVVLAKTELEEIDALRYFWAVYEGTSHDLAPALVVGEPPLF